MLKENLLDVLMYLFEQYMDVESELPDQFADLAPELVRDGFDPRDVDKALNWLDDLQVSLGYFHDASHANLKSMRVFNRRETIKITAHARNYLLYLERLGIIDTKSREMIIDRAMSLDESIIDMAEIKWISLVVLFNQKDQKNKLARLEALMLRDYGYVEH